MSRLIPLIILGFLSPFFIELQSGNIPFPVFFMPGTLIFLLTVGYGFPVILIREISVRYRMGLLSTLLLGLAYGLYNEGLIARTLIRNHSMPIEAFNGEGLFLGVNIGFMLIIILAHALQAIVYPILFTHHLVPKSRYIQLIHTKLIMFMCLVVFVFGTLSYFRTDNFGTGSIVSYIFLLGLILSLIFCAFVFRNIYHLNISGSWTSKTILRGATAVMPFIVVSATTHFLNVFSTLFLFAFIIYFIFRVVVKHHLTSEIAWIAFAVGHLTTGMLIGAATTVLFHPNPLPIIAGYLIVFAFLYFFKSNYLPNQTNHPLKYN